MNSRVFTADERYVNRRQFTKFLTLTSFGMFAGNLWILARSWLAPRAVVSAQPVAATGRDCRWAASRCSPIPTADDPCILVRTGADAYAAYSQKCTHLSCAVYYETEQNRLECPATRASSRSRMARCCRVLRSVPLPRVVLEREGGATGGHPHGGRSA